MAVPFSLSSSPRTACRGLCSTDEPALLQTDMHYTQEAGIGSLEHAINGIVLYKTVEWTGHVNKQGLLLLSLPLAFLRALKAEAWKVLVKHSKGFDSGYNPVVENNKLEMILRLSRYDGKDRECEPQW